MITKMELMPGVTLRCFPAQRFKQGCISIQFLRSMNREEAAMNALIPAVLLLGCKSYPNMRAVTLHLDELYGACINSLVRRIGDYQTLGFYASFLEDHFALTGDRILEPVMDFLGQLLLDPVTENGVFSTEFVESEKRNLIATIQTERNDKRAYTAAQLLKKMCAADSFGVPRLGEEEQVTAVTAQTLWQHYRRVLKESPVEVFYVGSAAPEFVAQRLRDLLAPLDRVPLQLPKQTAFCDGGGGEYTEEAKVTQGKLAMGFVTPVTNRDSEFAAVQVFNTLFGAGMTSKLFTNVREKMSLCYYIGSGYYGSKGIITVSAGIDSDKAELVRQEVLRQLDLCCQGQITDGELQAAKEAVLSGLRGLHDSPGSIEGFESVAAVSGMGMSVDAYRAAVEAVTVEAVKTAAQSVRFHTVYFLKGVEV